MNRKLKAFLSVFFGMFWFTIMGLGCSLLLLPQVIVNAYGNDAHWIERWSDFMDDVFDSFKEL